MSLISLKRGKNVGFREHMKIAKTVGQHVLFLSVTGGPPAKISPS